MSKTLLEKAKEIDIRKVHKIVTDEEIEVSIAFLKNEVGYAQIAEVTGYTRQNIQSRMSVVLREAYARGRIVIKEAK